MSNWYFYWPTVKVMSTKLTTSMMTPSRRYLQFLPKNYQVLGTNSNQISWPGKAGKSTPSHTTSIVVSVNIGLSSWQHMPIHLFPKILIWFLWLLRTLRKYIIAYLNRFQIYFFISPILTSVSFILHLHLDHLAGTSRRFGGQPWTFPGVFEVEISTNSFPSSSYMYLVTKNRTPSM